MVLAGAVLALGGCGRAGADQNAQDTTVAATTEAAPAEPSPTVSGASGSITQNFGVTNPDIANSLPDFVLIPDGSRVQVHMPFSNDRREGGMLMALAPMSQSAVIAFHRPLMSRNNLVPQPDAVGTKGETILLARSPDRTSEYRVYVFPPKNDEGTVFIINYFEPKA